MSDRTRAHWLGQPAFFELNQACELINKAFRPDAFGCYLVGSSLHKRDYRDVDVRCIMPDEQFEKFFGPLRSNDEHNATWCLLCMTISHWLRLRTGLPVDFQIQAQSIANSRYGQKQGHERNALGFYIAKPERDNLPAGR